jgi:hypothetical protein
VSGGWGVVPASFDDFRPVAIMLKEPLLDSNVDGVPDVVERCTTPEATADRCTDMRDGGVPPPVDGPEPDSNPPADAGEPDAPRDAGLPDRFTDAPRDTATDGG